MREAQQPVADGGDGAREEAKRKHDAHLDDLEAEEKNADEGDVAELLVEVAPAEEQHDRGKDALAGLVEHKTREVQGARLAHGHARAREAVDLGGRRAGAAGREAHKEDARGLDAHEVADAHRRVGIRRDGKHISQDTEHVIKEEADDARGDPPEVDARKGSDELIDLPGNHQVHRVSHDHEGEKDERLSDLAHRFLVRLGVLGRRLGRRGAAHLERDFFLRLLLFV